MMSYNFDRIIESTVNWFVDQIMDPNRLVGSDATQLGEL